MIQFIQTKIFQGNMNMKSKPRNYKFKTFNHDIIYNGIAEISFNKHISLRIFFYTYNKTQISILKNNVNSYNMLINNSEFNQLANTINKRLSKHIEKLIANNIRKTISDQNNINIIQNMVIKIYGA